MDVQRVRHRHDGEDGKKNQHEVSFHPVVARKAGWLRMGPESDELTIEKQDAGEFASQRNVVRYWINFGLAAWLIA